MRSVLSAPHFQNEEAAFAYVESKLWPAGPECPHCGVVDQAGRLKGKTTRPGLWKCYACRKPFTVRMRSVFESSHVPMTIWLQAMYLMCCVKKGISTRQLQRMIGWELKTAWFLGHRIREAMKETRDLFDVPMGGAGKVVEGDETFIGRKSTSRAFLPPSPKQSVMSLGQRGGKVRSFHVPNVTAANLQPIIVRHIHTDIRYMTDSGTVSVVLGFALQAARDSQSQQGRIRSRRRVHQYHRRLFLDPQAPHLWRVSARFRGAFAAVSDRVRFPLFAPDQAWRG